MQTKGRLIHLNFLILFLLLSMLSGCASVAVSLLGAGTGFGLPYAVNDDADRTLNLPFHQVERETPQVLEKMDISVTGYSEIENGKRIKASTRELDITIDIKQVTPKATRVVINARKSNFLKDKATSEEIINQLEKSLTRKMARKDRLIQIRF